jgi:hypothetical protein
MGGMTMTREELEAADRKAAELGRGGARLRLRIGEVLHVLDETAGFKELGFSSVRAYALERCEQGARWATESRRVARELLSKGGQGLSEVRAAVMSGQLAWSMAELMARHATPEDQAEALAAAGERTVAQMVEWFAERARAKNADIAAAMGTGDAVESCTESTDEDPDAGSDGADVRAKTEAGGLAQAEGEQSSGREAGGAEACVEESGARHGRPVPKQVPVAQRECSCGRGSTRRPRSRRPRTRS